jgi:hypothetical protein
MQTTACLLTAVTCYVLHCVAGTDSFTYRICDPLNACAQTTVTLTPQNRPPNVALLAELPAGYNGPAPTLTADRAGAAGTDCTENPATALNPATVKAPGNGQCSGTMPAGDYTLGQTANDLLVFDGWKCYKANVAGGF